MLIISGVAISVLTGEDGMFTNVSEATKEYKKQSLIELIKNAELALELDVILSENTANPIEKNIENLMNKIKELGNFKDGDIETDSYIEGEIGTGLIIDKTTGVVIDITMDKNGNVTVEGTVVDDVSDITRPEADVELDIPEGTYAETVTIKLTFKDEGSGIVKIQFPDGTVKTYDSEKEVSIEYPVTENGTYTFIVENANGRKSTTSVEVTNTMSVALITIENLNEEVTQGPINLKISYDANPRIGGQVLTNADKYQYRIGEESATNQWQTANTTVENGLAVATIQVPVNGLVYVRYFDGTEGHKTQTIDIQNIDKEKPEEFSIVANPTSGKETYSVTVTTATGSAVKDLGSDGEAELNIGIKGYQFQIKDSNGNIIKIKDSNGDVTLDWSAIQSGISYTFDNTTLANNLTEGATYTITMRAIDLAGNHRDASTNVKVTDIPDSDVEGTIGIKYIVDEVEGDSLGTPTKNNVKVKFTNNSGNNNLTLKYQINSTSGTWQTYPSAGVEMRTNGTVYARLYDGAGQSAGVATANINNIDKELPKAFNLSVSAPNTYSITVSGSTEDLYTANCASGNYGISGYQYKLMNSDGTTIVDWTTETTNTSYTFSKDTVSQIEQGGTYKVAMRAIDIAGNVRDASNNSTASITLESVADSSAQIGIKYIVNGEESESAGTPTKNNVTVKFTDNSGVSNLTLKYQIGSTSDTGWKTYPSTGVTLAVNGTVYARLYDTAGQSKGVAAASIHNIDKEIPTVTSVTPEVTTNSIKVTVVASDTGSIGVNSTNVGVAKYKYRIDNGSWSAETTSTTNTFTNLTHGSTHTIGVIAIDKAGNESTEYTKTNVQVTAIPTAVNNITIGVSPTTPTKEATVTLSTSVKGYSMEYKIGNGSWTPYTQGTIGFKVSSNTTIYARFVDGNNQNGTETSKVIDNIDTTPPSTATISSSDITQTSFKLNATGADDKGIKQYDFYVNGIFKQTVTTTSTTASITVDGLTAGTPYNNCYVMVYDQADNNSKSNTISVTTEAAVVNPSEVAVVGDFVNYSVTVGGVTYNKWRILNFDNNGHMEIVCYNGPAFTLGSSDNTSTAVSESKSDWTSAIQQLNNASIPYKNGTYGYSARHLGSDPAKPENYAILSSTAMSSITADLSDGLPDALSAEGVNSGIHETDRSVVETFSGDNKLNGDDDTDGSVWLASREACVGVAGPNYTVWAMWASSGLENGGIRSGSWGLYYYNEFKSKWSSMRIDGVSGARCIFTGGARTLSMTLSIAVCEIF